MSKDLNGAKAELNIDLTKKDNSTNLGLRMEKVKYVVKKVRQWKTKTLTLILFNKNLLKFLIII